DVCDFANVLPRTRQLRAEYGVCIRRVDGNAPVFEYSWNRPVAKRNLAIVTAALGCRASGLLLSAIHPVREAVVGRDVVKLSGRLVVPSAPGNSAIHADCRTLVSGDRDHLWVIRADPEPLVVVAPWGSFPPNKALSRVRRFPCRRVGHVDCVWIVGGYRDAHGTRAAATDAVIGIHLCPRLTRVVRPVNSRFLLLC